MAHRPRGVFERTQGRSRKVLPVWLTLLDSVTEINKMHSHLHIILADRLYIRIDKMCTHEQNITAAWEVRADVGKNR